MGFARFMRKNPVSKGVYRVMSRHVLPAGALMIVAAAAAVVLYQAGTVVHELVTADVPVAAQTNAADQRAR